MRKRIAAAGALIAVLGGCNEAQRAVVSGLKSYRMTTTSMEPALKNGEYVFAEAYTGTPNPPRGEIIVFRYPLQPKTVFAKRVVAIPGDKVQIVRKQLYVNGTVPNEPYAMHLDPNLYEDPSLPEPYKSRDNFGPVTLAPDEFFVLGDNRDSSSDSRYWGAVPRANIVGKVVSAGDISGSLRSVH